MHSVTIEDLKKIVALSDLPNEHLQWILEHSEYREYADGDLLFGYGTPAELMTIILEGNVAYYMYINGRQVYYFTFGNNDVTGGIGGIMPYSRMKTFPGYSYALGTVKLLCIHKNLFPEMEQMNPDFIQRLIGYMTERAKIFATVKLQHEKVDALGNLAAGIAHELNNPAAAIRGIADELSRRLNYNYDFTKTLLECNMTANQIENIQSLVKNKEAGQTLTKKLSAIQRMEIEDELADWLEENGVTQIGAAETFSEYGFSLEELEDMRSNLGAAAFVQLIPWLENLISSQRIIKDLADASGRISTLVGSIKSHVHMDRTNELQPTNLHVDIENTITLLGFKLREKNIEVIKRFSPDLPPVPAYVGELNQVWTNLIDNAIFAVEKNGTITIETLHDEKNVLVHIIDNGIGIPEEIISRIFDPFFTTKKVGEGTGIGLDTVSRIIKHHNGDIKVSSKPGRTRFTVSIPFVQKQSTN
ncbi:MAG: ATP-binding protein [Bacteroidota bacterium]|nr:ATP-binding protein [Bacteroidota bacterium]